MIDVPPGEVPVLGIVAEHPDMETEGLRIAAHLRQQKISVEVPLRGNVKRRTEIARKRGVRAILFVKKAENVRDALNLSQRREVPGQGMKFFSFIFGKLPEPYRQLSGDEQLDQLSLEEALADEE
jgi:histidyl-tRNA synthetase